MFEKSKKRALRRWRSWCVWMRRLRGDWNDHGWKRNPPPWYDGSSWRRDGTTLCNCFFLDHREAYRFKNTPNGDSFFRKDFGKYREFGDPIQERRLEDVPERVAHSGNYPRNRRAHIVNQSCRVCGVLIGRVPAHARTWETCKACKLKAKVLS
jgi:hypothetical protein